MIDLRHHSPGRLPARRLAIPFPRRRKSRPQQCSEQHGQKSLQESSSRGRGEPFRTSSQVTGTLPRQETRNNIAAPRGSEFRWFRAFPAHLRVRVGLRRAGTRRRVQDESAVRPDSTQPFMLLAGGTHLPRSRGLPGCFPTRARFLCPKQTHFEAKVQRVQAASARWGNSSRCPGARRMMPSELKPV